MNAEPANLGMPRIFDAAEQAMLRWQYGAHTGRKSYCLFCGEDGPCEAWLDAKARLEALEASGGLDDGTLRGS